MIMSKLYAYFPYYFEDLLSNSLLGKKLLGIAQHWTSAYLVQNCQPKLANLAQEHFYFPQNSHSTLIAIYFQLSHNGGE